MEHDGAPYYRRVQTPPSEAPPPELTTEEAQAAHWHATRAAQGLPRARSPFDKTDPPSQRRGTSRERNAKKSKNNARITSLNVARLGITSLDGMEPLENLEVLCLQENELVTFYGMPTHPNLKFLHVDSNRITSFLGMSHLPHLEILTMEANPICSHPNFRIMAMLACGETLQVINYRVVIDREREIVRALGGSGGWAARCVCFGWTGLRLEEVTEDEYIAVFEALKQDYRRAFDSVDKNFTFGNVMARLTAHQEQEEAAAAEAEATGGWRALSAEPVLRQPPVRGQPLSSVPPQASLQWPAPLSGAAVAGVVPGGLLTTATAAIARAVAASNSPRRETVLDHERQRAAGIAAHRGATAMFSNGPPPLTPPSSVLLGQRQVTRADAFRSLYAHSGLPRDIAAAQRGEAAGTADGRIAVCAPLAHQLPPPGLGGPLPRPPPQRDAEALLPSRYSAIEAARLYAQALHRHGTIAGVNVPPLYSTPPVNFAGRDGGMGGGSLAGGSRPTTPLSPRAASAMNLLGVSVTSLGSSGTAGAGASAARPAPGLLLLQSEVGCVAAVELDGLDATIQCDGATEVRDATVRVNSNSGELVVLDRRSRVFSCQLATCEDIRLDKAQAAIHLVGALDTTAEHRRNRQEGGGEGAGASRSSSGLAPPLATVTLAVRPAATAASSPSRGVAAATAPSPDDVALAKGVFKTLMLFKCTPEELDALYRASTTATPYL